MRYVLFSFVMFFIPLLIFPQDRIFLVLPHANSTISGKEGLLETGPEFEWNYQLIGKSFFIKPLIRFPVTSANENTLQIDRFSPTWRAILAMEYGSINNLECIKKDGYSVGLQVEYGLSDFIYYPASNKAAPVNEMGTSYAIELKYISFYMLKQLNARELSPQFRLRFSHNVNPSNPVGVVIPANGGGFATTSEIVINKPSTTYIISPAIAVEYYSGIGYFTYSPTIYYDFYGSSVNGSSARTRLEFGLFFYPLIKTCDFKIGLIPFISLRSMGTDNSNAIVYGGQISLRIGTSFLQYF